MKIRTIYQKVQNLDKARTFWESFLGIRPVKSSNKWCAFQLENLLFALLLNDYGDDFKGTNCVPVFEFGDHEIKRHVEKTKALGGTVVFDGLADPNIQSIVIKDPSGNEFEISKVHS
jgi:catechol 2,3-dioxygenase-like lactoylglutathione lyase family enzyme